MNIRYILFLIIALAVVSSASAVTYIHDCQELQDMKNDLTGSYELANDIDCSDTVNWNDGAGFLPVGKNTAPFIGSFNGKCYTIFNLYINRQNISRVGLFGSVKNSIISNAALENVNIVGGSSGYSYVGSLVGYNDHGEITNSHSIGSVSGYRLVGGLIGFNGYGKITNSYSKGIVICREAGGNNIGGLVGSQDYGIIQDSYSTVNVEGKNCNGIGGLVGESNYAFISNSYSTGNVAGYGSVGGLVGGSQNSYYGTESPIVIINSYSTGNVTGTHLVGGLSGHLNGGTVQYSHSRGTVTTTGIQPGGGIYLGGLIGLIEYGGSIISSYSTGDVISRSTNDRVGGLVGYQIGGGIYNSYSMGSVSGNDNVGGLVGFTYINNGYYSTITNSYSIGSVTGNTNAGGLVGTIIYGGDVSFLPLCINSFWNTQTSGQTASACGIGKTTVDMKTQSTYTAAGWNFTDVWNVCTGINEDYPILSDERGNSCDIQMDKTKNEGFDQDNDGYTSCNGDCNDHENTVYPGAMEVCDSKDNDCNIQTDEGFPNNDADSYASCVDCQDSDAAVYPRATEICDGKDNNCNCIIDEGLTDYDDDGYAFCTDCNENDPAVHPGAPELCDGKDNNCDGTVDEGCGCTKILVTATDNEVLDTSNRPASTRYPIAGKTVYLYNKECQTGQWTSCTPLTSCVTDANGKCELNSYDGMYTTVMDYGNGIYVSDVGLPVKCDKTVDSKLHLISAPTGEVLPAKATKITGSLLEIIEPEYVIWDGAEEFYPFIFIADGDWEIDTSIYAPEGYEPDVPSIVTLVANEAKAIMFKMIEVGSVPGKTKVSYNIKHNGKKQKIDHEIGFKMTPAFEKAKASEKSKGRAITGAAVADASSIAVSFMGVITLAAIVGLVIVSSLALKIFLPKGRKPASVRRISAKQRR